MVFNVTNERVMVTGIQGNPQSQGNELYIGVSHSVFNVTSQRGNYWSHFLTKLKVTFRVKEKDSRSQSRLYINAYKHI